jgi:molecular chaperone DnaK (HSP70)
MLKEAEKYKEEDQQNRDRIESKNKLESFLFNMKSTVMNNNEIKLSESDKKTVLDTVDDGIKWLENSEQASKEEYDGKFEEVSGIVNPIISKIYGGAAEGPSPQVDEVD